MQRGPRAWSATAAPGDDSVGLSRPSKKWQRTERRALQRGEMSLQRGDELAEGIPGLLGIPSLDQGWRGWGGIIRPKNVGLDTRKPWSGSNPGNDQIRYKLGLDPGPVTLL